MQVGSVLPSLSSSLPFCVSLHSISLVCFDFLFCICYRRPCFLAVFVYSYIGFVVRICKFYDNTEEPNNTGFDELRLQFRSTIQF